MKTYIPDYYGKFKCIANKCKHSCCIGWEIDIDDETLTKYTNIQGSIGKKLADNICVNNDGAYFKLNDHERCPFLDNNNLCEIILNLGEDSLCQICADHPRYRNFFDNRIEIGLGLCCEAAAELILKKQTPTKLICTELNSAPETDFEINRNKIISILQNRTYPFEERIRYIREITGIFLPEHSATEYAKILLTLEQLDSEWTTFLTSVGNNSTTTSGTEPTDTELEQLAVYFIYRHLTPDDFDITLRFALICTKILHSFSPYYSFYELCRMFSSEIEYSQENTDFLMNL